MAVSHFIKTYHNDHHQKQQQQQQQQTCGKTVRLHKVKCLLMKQAATIFDCLDIRL
jgi:predicted metallo-beta-lactamase superfamily hydrolase